MNRRGWEWSLLVLMHPLSISSLGTMAQIMRILCATSTENAMTSKGSQRIKSFGIPRCFNRHKYGRFCSMNRMFWIERTLIELAYGVTMNSITERLSDTVNEGVPRLGIPGPTTLVMAIHLTIIQAPKGPASLSKRSIQQIGKYFE
jgi:hypothetical protein